MTAPSWLEILGFATGVACVWLLVRENVWNWPVGIANNLFYLVVFYRSGLYADSGLQVGYVALSIYGWWHWLRGGAGHSRLAVGRIGIREALAVAGATTLATAGLAALLARFTPSTVPLSDALTTALSLAAQYLQARKFLENWWVWIAADVVYIGLYLYKDLALTALLYAVFLALCVAGLRRWRRRV
ncbi:MAG: nicotinamide riboside transporter PnuC [Thermoanaerobaculia bacterium]